MNITKPKKKLYTTGYGIKYPLMEYYVRNALKHDKDSALLLPGGGDVSSDLYGMPHHPSMYGVRKVRDLFELDALKEALQYKRPVLAICRGHQLTAVHFGAKLIQDIDTPHPEFHELAFLQEPKDTVGKQLFALLKTTCSSVNSMHHQGVALSDVPREGVCLAHYNNVSEAVWYPEHRILSVQFHPEWMGKQGMALISTFLEIVDKV